MRSDEKGFLYPFVERDACLQCGLCETICPVLNSEKNKSPVNSTFYGCKNSDDSVRRSSSSGGFFYELARSVINRNGVVFGARFSEDFKRVYHSAATTLDEVGPLMVSKYVQSEIRQSYVYVKEYLEKGREVLYTGTPCQIAGLRLFLGDVPDHLLLAEVVCHGIPSAKVWDIYLTELEKQYKSKVNHVTFRDKTNGWHRSDFVAGFEDGTEFRQANSDNPFMKAFLENLSIRPSCSACHFKRFVSGADFTMGDFWGSTELGPSYSDDTGISVIALNTDKGRHWFDLIRKGLEGVVELDEKTAYTFNNSYARSAVLNEHSAVFFASLSQGCFSELVCGLSDDVKKQSGQSKSIPVHYYRRIVKLFKDIIKNGQS
jgi:coenzyme F420-reducing hydrogenase beta subunit